MHDFMSDLSKSERPGILVGGGARSARRKIIEFSELHSIPVFRTWNALDVVTDDCAVFGGTVGTYGGSGRNFGIQNTDLLLVLGCKMSGRILGGMPETFAKGAKIWRVDVDSGLLNPDNQEKRCDVNIQSTCSDFVGNLIISSGSFSGFLEQCMGSKVAFSKWLGQCRNWVEQYDPVKQEHIREWHHYGFVRLLSESLPSNAVVVYDTGGNSIMMGHCFRSKEGQRIFSSNGNSPMGFALCGAIGAWFADPSRPVYCIIGDGGMQLNIQELQTINHYGVNVKIIVLNNHCLGNTKSYERANHKAEIACGPDGYSCPDFISVAKAYGIKSMSLGEWMWWPYVRDAMLESTESMLIDVVHDDFCDYAPRMVSWDKPIHDMQPYLDREEFNSNMM